MCEKLFRMLCVNVVFNKYQKTYPIEIRKCDYFVNIYQNFYY